MPRFAPSKACTAVKRKWMCRLCACLEETRLDPKIRSTPAAVTPLLTAPASSRPPVAGRPGSSSSDLHCDSIEIVATGHQHGACGGLIEAHDGMLSVWVGDTQLGSDDMRPTNVLADAQHRHRDFLGERAL